MASGVSERVIDGHEPKLLADFGCQVLGFRVLEEEDGYVGIGPEEGFGGVQPTLIFSPTTEPKTTKLRLHIDINPVGVDQDAELERLLALGARPADGGPTGEESWHLLQDPKGNDFCCGAAASAEPPLCRLGQHAGERSG